MQGTLAPGGKRGVRIRHLRCCDPNQYPQVNPTKATALSLGPADNATVCWVAHQGCAILCMNNQGQRLAYYNSFPIHLFYYVCF